MQACFLKYLGKKYIKNDTFILFKNAFFFLGNIL